MSSSFPFLILFYAATCLCVCTSKASEESLAARKWVQLPPDSKQGSRWQLEFDLSQEKVSPLDGGVIEIPVGSQKSSTDTGLLELYQSIEGKDDYIGSSVIQLEKSKIARINVTDAIKRSRQAGQNSVLFQIILRVEDGLLHPVSLVSKNPPKLKLAQAHPLPPTLGPLVPENSGRQVIAEAVMPVGDVKDGIRCPLLFIPERIESVFNALNGQVYEEKRDYVLYPEGIEIPPGSRIQTVPESELYSKPPGMRTFKMSNGRQQVAPEGSWWNQRQIAVSYRAKEHFNSRLLYSDAEIQRRNLSRMIARMTAKQASTVLVYGDSISVGANASGRLFVPPFLPSWSELLVQECREAYGVILRLKNYSLGGMTSQWGKQMAPALLAKEPADLVIVAFGMNDRGRILPDDFQANIKSIIDQARSANPQTDILLVSSMRHNPLWNDPKYLDEYRKVLGDLTGPGVALADMTAVSDFLLRRKPFLDLTGNGVNHPNDYLVRWYAKTLSVLLLPE